MADESIRSELSKRVREIILLIEQRSFCEDDLIQFRLDWLYNAIVRYVDQVPYGEEVMSLVRQAVQLTESGTDSSSNVSFQADFVHTGQRGRPRYSISIDQLELLLDMRFTSGEIASMFGVSESTVKRRIQEFYSFVKKKYSDIFDETLDGIVERLMREFPNCMWVQADDWFLD